MRILIIGASSEKSIGYLLGESLKKERQDVLYASRSGTLGEQCDLLVQDKVEGLLAKLQPEAVVHAAGVFTTPQALDEIDLNSQVAQHLLVKSLGAIVLLAASRRTPSVRHVIMIGGRAVSSDPGFAVYTAANGALWALTQFAADHERDHFVTYYIDLPLVENSMMGLRLFPDGTPEGSITAEKVAESVEEILREQHESDSRIILGENWTI